MPGLKPVLLAHSGDAFWTEHLTHVRAEDVLHVLAVRSCLQSPVAIDFREVMAQDRLEDYVLVLLHVLHLDGHDLLVIFVNVSIHVFVVDNDLLQVGFVIGEFSGSFHCRFPDWAL